jgi:hypothetical protein
MRTYTLELTEQEIWALLWAGERAEMSLESYTTEELIQYRYNTRLASLERATKKLNKEILNRVGRA